MAPGLDVPAGLGARFAGRLPLGLALSKGVGVTVGLAANQGKMATGVLSLVGANVTSVREHYASPEGAISNLVFTDCNWYIVPGTYVLSGTGNSVTFRKYLEYPAGVYTPVLYSGSVNYTIADSGQATSDPVAVKIPAGAKFWEHTVNTSGTSKSIANIVAPANHSVIGLDNTTYNFSGSPTRPAATASINSYGASCITGTIAKAGARGFAIVGNSIAWGQNDISSVGVKGGSGYIQRGLDPRYPWMVIGVPGMTGVQMAALSASAPMLALIAATKTTHMINEFGGGDLRVGETVPAIKAAFQTVYGMFSGKRRYQTTVLPRTDSTDGYITTANQTAKTDGNWANEVTLNTDIRAGLPTVDGYIESSDVACTARDSRIWKAPPARTTDGVHPNSSEAAELADGVIAAYAFA